VLASGRACRREPREGAGEDRSAGYGGTGRELQAAETGLSRMTVPLVAGNVHGSI